MVQFQKYVLIFNKILLHFTQNRFETYRIFFDQLWQCSHNLERSLQQLYFGCCEIINLYENNIYHFEKNHLTTRKTS
jgi:hypothetical protein